MHHQEILLPDSGLHSARPATLFCKQIYFRLHDKPIYSLEGKYSFLYMTTRPLGPTPTSSLLSPTPTLRSRQGISFGPTMANDHWVIFAPQQCSGCFALKPWTPKSYPDKVEHKCKNCGTLLVYFPQPDAIMVMPPGPKGDSTGERGTWWIMTS